MNCPKCGNAAAPGAAFCAICGSNFAGGMIPGPGVPPPMPAYGYQQPMMMGPQRTSGMAIAGFILALVVWSEPDRNAAPGDDAPAGYAVSAADDGPAHVGYGDRRLHPVVLLRAPRPDLFDHRLQRVQEVDGHGEGRGSRARRYHHRDP